MPWDGRPLAAPPVPTPFARSRGDLIAGGYTARGITAAVRADQLVRARNGVYLAPDDHADLRTAARVGGRLTCLSELHRRGVFVLSVSRVHVHLAVNAGRMRKVENHVVRHWDVLARQPHPRATAVEPLDAVLHAVRCQEPRAAVATLDSALRLGVLRDDELGELFARLPLRYQVLRRMLDPRAGSGTESLMRLLLRKLGCAFEVQVEIDGVGRVDFVVDGWLIIECDSEEHHSSWEARRRDLRRDQTAAALGYTTYRPIAEDIMWHADDVLAAIRGLLARGSRSRRR